MENIKRHLAKVDVLPPSPALLPKLLPKLADVDANFDEIVELIAFDPSLTSKLLQICNSAYFGHKMEVESVADAVNQVGYQAIHLLVAMISGSACFVSTPGLDATRLWTHSITTAFHAKFVAESAGLDGSLLFTAGILHDLGKIILSQEKTPASTGLFQGPSDAASLAREKDVYGCNHADIGGGLLEHWKLPGQIIIAVRHHHDPKGAPGFQRIACCVTLGDLLTHSQEHPKIIESAEFKDAMALLGLTAADHMPRWKERLRDHQGLIGGMSRLPI